MEEKKNKTTKNSTPSIFDYFRFGESYTSLILGIIVVIVATVLILSFFHNRNVIKLNNARVQMSQVNTQPAVKPTDTPATSSISTVAAKEELPAKTSRPAKVAKKVTSPQKSKKEKTHIVVAGENLWVIAEKEYKSGYNWVDIASANNLSNPNNIQNGAKLILPNVEQKNASSVPEISNNLNINVAQNARIAGNKYLVAKGDTLWSIAVRAYGDGYQWVKISSANKLSNPGLIFSGNILRIPHN